MQFRDDSGCRQRPFEVESSRLKEYLAWMGRLYPGIWKMADELRSQRRRHDPAWPEWCFLPFSNLCNILAEGDYLARDQRSNISQLGGLMAWRVTQGVYQIDPTVFDELWNMPLEGGTPYKVLYHLPEWCVYVSTPPRPWLDRVLHGFFAHLDVDATVGHPQIRFLLDVGESRPCAAIPVDLNESTLAEAVESTRGRYLTELASRTEDIQVCAEEISNFAALDLHEYAQSVTPLMNLVLYLCSVNAEIRDRSGLRERPQRPPMTRTRKGLRMFPPEEPTTWEAGWRLGAALRRAVDGAHKGHGDGSHASPRPHIRRAHWHSYWTGPKTAGERSIGIRWMPPVGVKTGEVHGIVPVLRRVPPAVPALVDQSPAPWGMPVSSPGTGVKTGNATTTSGGAVSATGERAILKMPAPGYAGPRWARETEETPERKFS